MNRQLRLIGGSFRGLIFGVMWLLVTLCMVPATSRAAINRGPYLSFVNDPNHCIVVSWGTGLPSAGIVQFGTGIPYSDVAVEATSDTLHHVELSGLTGNTHYYYRVICDLDTATGDFWTAPTPSQAFEIIAYGDSRSNPTVHRTVVDRYMQYPHRLILSTGDLAYHGELWEFDAYLFQPAATAMMTSPFISIVGGHDSDPWNTPPNFTFTNYQTLMELPGNELYFSFDYGPMHVIALNSEVAWQYGPQTPETQWIEADLTATNQPYRIAIFHMPPYTSGTGNPNNMGIRQYWCPIFRQHHVQMVLNGHQHFYQRCEPGDGIKYVITGGGGAGLYTPTFDSSYVVAAAQAYHFLWVEVNPDSIHVTAIDTANTVLDEFSILPWTPNVPAQVRFVTMQQAPSSSVQLTWNAVRQNTMGDPIVVDQYHIYRDPATPDFAPDLLHFLASTPDTTWTDISVPPDMIHAFYKVTAVLLNP